MKYVVELFDGRRIRGLLMSKQQKEELMNKLDQLDPTLGVVVLDVTPEHLWKAGKHADANRRRATPWMDLERTLPLDRMMA
ncbi:MAG: hypothetical protein HQL94_08360 [Magnetococcales bacterium]|nr:hypothetical protein [Magnetococcales bacterium]MBF0439974.1 hypothetical protein [Magnetococcales bacterium]